jgi:hypothetical protein
MRNRRAAFILGPDTVYLSNKAGYRLAVQPLCSQPITARDQLKNRNHLLSGGSLYVSAERPPTSEARTEPNSKRSDAYWAVRSSRWFGVRL